MRKNKKKFGLISLLVLFVICGMFNNSSNQSSTKSTYENTTNLVELDYNTQSKQISINNPQVENEEIELLSTSTQDTQTVNTSQTQTNSIKEPVTIHFIDTGNSDCILICDNGKYAVIDGADNDDEKLLVKYLNDLKIEQIDYLILTHLDADHCGGLDAIVKNFKINQVFVGNGNTDTKTYKDFVQSVTDKNLKPSIPLKDKTFTLGCGTFKFYNQEKVWDNTNDNSLVALYTIGSNRFLFMGDSGKQVEATLPLNEIGKIDVLKVGHHGSSSSTSDAFIKNISPKYSVICCGKDNKYGHPHKETLKVLNDYKVSTYRTDVGGTTIFTSDGNSVKATTKGKINDASTTSVSNGKIETDRITIDTTKQSTSDSSEYTVYITNTGSKYHALGCRYLKKSCISIDIDKAKAQGYSPCSSCNP
jgi:beta-lactamase superfamily II metal-dependent hydrolase